jgi:peroxiredoxin Q/BCP
MTRLRPLLLLAAAQWLLAAGCTTTRPDGGQGLLPVGSTAPEVVGLDVHRTEVRLSAQQGKKTVVFFYPKDGSPGCTKEVCAFRDNWKWFQEANIAVIGISSDSEERHMKWLEEKKLPFALSADESGTVAKAYGVSKMLWGFSRVTFLVGPDGKIAQVWPNVDPAVNATEVLAAAAQLK